MRHVFLGVCFLASAPLTAAVYVPEMPRDVDQVEMHLLTAGYGDEVYSVWGHTAIRVIDHLAGTDIVYNWGFFDFAKPNFTWNFFKGILEYELGLTTYPGTLRTYKIERRSLWEDKLNFTHLQKEKLLRKMIWNAQPENRTYPYQYFFNNCSTIVRDYLDEVLGGVLRKRFAQTPGSGTYRMFVRKHMAAMPLQVMSLDILMNSRLERTATQYEEMFLPVAMRDLLLTVGQVDDAGVENTASKFLTESRNLLTYPAPEPAAWSGYVLVALPLALLLVLGFALGVFAKQRDMGLRLLGVAGLGLWTFAFAFGVVMTASWAVSEHLDLQHNVNLLLFFPIDFLLMFCAVRLAGWGERGLRNIWRTLFWTMAWLHMAGIFLALGGLMAGGIQQDIRKILFLYAPLMIAWYFSVNVLDRSKQRLA